jgi:Predicted permeases
MWFTQAIREFDLITSQRQTMFVFIGITGLLIPLLVMMIAPISLVLATAHIINKLSSDSEIIVMNAAGVSPWPLVRPFLAAGLVVAALVAAIAVYISPWSLRELRDWATQVRADILTNIVQPGRFTTISGNLTFHIADRRPNGLLVGIFLDDRRDPKEHATYLAEQGEIVKNDTGSFLVLEKGSVQRLELGQRDPRIVTFDRYAFDLRNSASVLRPAASPTTRVKSTSGNSCGRPRTTRCSWRSPASTDRNCTIALRRRCTRSPSSSSRTPFSGRRRPRDRAALCRFWPWSASWPCCGWSAF